jgi:hypothetical protein
VGEEIKFTINDTTRAINKVIKDLYDFNSPLCDERVKTLIIMKLQESAMWSLQMISQKEETSDGK